MMGHCTAFLSTSTRSYNKTLRPRNWICADLVNTACAQERHSSTMASSTVEPPQPPIKEPAVVYYLYLFGCVTLGATLEFITPNIPRADIPSRKSSHRQPHLKQLYSNSLINRNGLERCAFRLCLTYGPQIDRINVVGSIMETAGTPHEDYHFHKTKIAAGKDSAGESKSKCMRMLPLTGNSRLSSNT